MRKRLHKGNKMERLHWPRSRDPDIASHRVTASDVGWRYISFEARRLSSGEVVEAGGAGVETAIIILSGQCSTSVGGRAYSALGSRTDVFADVGPVTVLGEVDHTVEITADSDAEVVIARAPATEHRPTRIIEAESVRIDERGEGSTYRRVRQVLSPSEPAARLILVEVLTPGGNWSSYPPHKHDVEDQPVESYLEELYYYRFDRPEGYALQRVYTPDRTLDEVVVARDGDVVVVPRGYHPVSAAPGAACYYLNVMAGPTRLWNFTLDPDHAWLAHQPATTGPRPAAR